jgi:hypothetical protein
MLLVIRGGNILKDAKQQNFKIFGTNLDRLLVFEIYVTRTYVTRQLLITCACVFTSQYSKQFLAIQAAGSLSTSTGI